MAYDLIEPEEKQSSGFDVIEPESKGYEVLEPEKPALDLSKFKLSPYEQSQLAPPDSNRQSYSISVPPSLNPEFDFTRATRGNPILAVPLATGAKATGMSTEKAEQFPFTPLANPPHFGEQELSVLPPLGQKLATAYNALSDDLKGLSTPEMLAQLPAGANKGMQLAFLGQISGHFPELAQNVADAKTPEERIGAWTHLVDTAAMAGLLAHGMKGEAAPVSPEKFPVEWRDIQKGEPSASTQPSAESVSQPEIRTSVGESAPLRQQGEVAGTTPAAQTGENGLPKEPVAPESVAKEIGVKFDGVQDYGFGNKSWGFTRASDGMSFNVPLDSTPETIRSAYEGRSKLHAEASGITQPTVETKNAPLEETLPTTATPTEQSVQKYRLGNNPQTHTIVETLKASPVEIENGEQPVKIKSDKTGEVQTVMKSDLSPVKTRTVEEKAASKKSSVPEKLKSLGYSDAEIAAMPKAGAKALAERGNPKPDASHDWTGATDKPKSSEQIKNGLKIKLGDKRGGFVNADILNDFVEYGKSVYEKGMTYAKWAAHVAKEFGKDALQYANKAWQKILTAYRNSEFSNETGAISFGGRGAIRKQSELDVATSERSAKVQKSFADAERARKEIKRVAPIEKRQNAISVWMEANGDAPTLASWESAAKGKMFKQAAKDAQSLTPEEIAMAQKSRSAFYILEARGNTYDVLGSHRDNYVPHVWNVEKKFTGIGSSRLQDQFKFNKARTFNNFFEGDQAGFVPKTLAIGRLLPSYLHEMNRVIADRQFIESVADKKSSEGTPLVIPRGKVSEVSSTAGGKAYLANPNSSKLLLDASGKPIDQSGYRVLNGQPALTDWRWEGKDAAGNPIFMKDDLAVHPELAKRLNAMMGKSAIREWYNEPSTGLSVVPKAIAKGIDTAQSVMKREMFGLLAPFHQVQEGTHAIGHLVNPFYNIPDMRRVLPEHEDAMNHGLVLFPEKSSAQGYLEGVGGKGSFLSKAANAVGQGKMSENKVGQASRLVSDVVDGYQNYLFHEYIPGLKFKTYEAIQSRNMNRFSKELASGEVSEADVKMLSALQTNAAYGHLNYALMDRNPTIQHLLQLGLLAPDFLEARARFTGQALKSLAGKKAGNEQFKAIATLAAIQAGIAYTLTTLGGDEYDPKHPFEVIHKGRRYAMRSVPEDLDRLFFQGGDSRREFISSRINPVAQKIDQLRTGINYRGEKTTSMETMEELLANYIPITARSIPAIRNLTESGRNNPVSPLEQLAGSLGLRVSRYSPISETYSLASKWKESKGIEKDRGSYPVSKYQQLRYALEDGDSVRAKTEFDELVKSGEPASKIRTGFRENLYHPFTGSASKDSEFSKSLTGKDKMIYDLAVKKRNEIWNRFSRIR